MSFEVQLELFRGPVDLLLYLVRRDELSVTELPLAKITEQYCEYLEILEELNVDEVGEFIEVAAFLLELKARNVLPQPKSESEELWQPASSADRPAVAGIQTDPGCGQCIGRAQPAVANALPAPCPG